MPEIEIRPAISSDIPHLVALDHNYVSDFTWQMEVKSEESKIRVNFRQIRLPRSVRVEYPRLPARLVDEWIKLDEILIAIYEEAIIAYISLKLNLIPHTTWVKDLVVTPSLRRQGIGSALVLAAEEVGLHHENRRILLEIQPKNYPALQLARKLGFDFCGYNDHYYNNRDLVLFFAKPLR